MNNKKVEIEVIDDVSYLERGDILTGTIDSGTFSFSDYANEDSKDSDIKYSYSKTVSVSYDFIRANEDCFTPIDYISWEDFDKDRKQVAEYKASKQLDNLRKELKEVKEQLEAYRRLNRFGYLL